MFFGTGAARNKIISELLSFEDLSKIDIKHLEIIADEMLANGELGKISRAGAGKRINNSLHAMANFGVAKVAEESARLATHSKVEGISPYLMAGDIPRIGTVYN